MKKERKFRIAIFASGNGTNAKAIMEHFQEHPQIEVALVLSNVANAYVLTRAGHHHVPSRVFDKAQFRDNGEVLRWLQESGITHIVLAGFLWLVPTGILQSYPNAIINIHPALLPKFGGKGMHGSNVHEKVKSMGEKETGITIHLVNENFDEGKILFQATCPVETDDSPESIAKKVHALEHAHYPKIIGEWILSG